MVAVATRLNAKDHPMSATTRTNGTPPRRWWLWTALLGVCGWLAVFGDKSPSGASLPAQATAQPAAQPAATPVTAPARVSAPAADVPAREAVLALTPRDTLMPPTGARPGAGRDLFVAHSWAPVVKPVVPAPVAPTAPPLPYTYLGKKLENGEWEIYLARGERTLIARQGARLDADYQVDGVAPPVLTLTYLPLGLTQTLPIGDTR